MVAALALFALVSAWLVQRHLDEQRVRAESVVRERVVAWGDLLERALPAPDAPRDEQAVALNDWSQRLRVPMALDDAAGKRIAESDSFRRRGLMSADNAARLQSLRFDDGRTLWVPRLNPLRAQPGAGPGPPRPPWLPGGGGPRSWPEGVGLLVLLLVLFAGIAAGAWPVVRRLTRRLEALKLGVEAFGAGALHQRVAEDGRDEVAAVGASFNRAAARIEALLRSHQSLLANASHELRSPLARLKMAVALLDDAAPAQRTALRKEIDTDIRELDALVEEVLLASRLDASATLERREPVELLPLAAEEAARVGATLEGVESGNGAGGDGAVAIKAAGDEKLIRRALRNLLENARRYGGDTVELSLQKGGSVIAPLAELHVADRGPGVPEAQRERIFEPFYRLPGHAEREGGVGLGLSLVRQIAERHGGSVRCLAREGGGSVFVLSLPLAP